MNYLKRTNTDKKNTMEEIKKIYFTIRSDIKKKLSEFERVWEKGCEEEIFAELVFCILTPQSKAKLCWLALMNISERNLLLKGNKNQIAKVLNIVRFKNKKAEYIIKARKLFSSNGSIFIKSQLKQFSDPFIARDWLVGNVRGIGYKEASHFLRNIGLGENLAILDRHILKNLKFHRIIQKIPNSLTKNKYYDIEKRMKKFSEEINIPMSHLDLVMWYKETGEVFK